MEQWIRNSFEIIPNGWDVGQDSFRFLSNGRITESSVNWFCETFGDVTIPPTIEGLKAIDPDDTLGWHMHFDAWKAKGILN